MVTTTAIYAGILALISIVLAHGAGQTRARLGIPLGDGGNGELIGAIRRHANFAEFVPLIVVMMAMIEVNGAKKWWLHALGIAIVVARIIHPIGISHSQMSSPFRMIGSMLTAAVTVACAVMLLIQGVRPFLH
jgi:uncharacterized membrane protein YecN with MAPEG domain